MSQTGIPTCPYCGVAFHRDVQRSTTCPYCGRTIYAKSSKSGIIEVLVVAGVVVGVVCLLLVTGLVLNLLDASETRGASNLGGTPAAQAAAPAAQGTRTRAPTYTPHAWPTGTPTPRPAPTIDVSSCALGAAYVADVTIPDGSTVHTGMSFTKVWLVRNTGTCPWEEGQVALLQQEGSQITGPAQVGVPPCAPGEEVQVEVTMRCQEEGSRTGRWRLCAVGGDCFGPTLTTVVVSAREPTAKPPSTLGEVHTSGGAAVGVSDVDRRTRVGYWSADAGNEYVSLGIHCANVGSSGTLHVNALNFSLMTDQGVIYSHEWLGALEPQLPTVSLAPGARIKGWLTFQVPKGSSRFTLIWKPFLFGGPIEVPVQE